MTRRFARLKPRPVTMGVLPAMGSSKGASFGVGTPSSGTPVDVIGWQNTSPLSLQSNWQPIWTTKAPAPSSGGGGVAPAFNPTIAVQPNISIPVTTQTTTAVSPVLNVAAGSQGVSQGARTDQTATPSSENVSPQGSTAGGGLSPEQVRQMLEQQQRESDAMAAQRAQIAAQAAALSAERQAWEQSQKQAAEYEARIRALQQAAQAPTIQPQQYAPQSAPAAPNPPEPTTGEKYPGLPPGTIVPGAKPSDSTAPALQDSKTVVKQPGIPLLAALAVGALIFMGGKKQPANRKKRR